MPFTIRPAREKSFISREEEIMIRNMARDFGGGREGNIWFCGPGLQDVAEE